MTKLLHKELTGSVIGVYYDVYNALSQTYPEFVFEKAMMADLRRLGIPCVRQDRYEIYYFGGPEPEFERRVLTPSAWEASLPDDPPERWMNTEGLLYPELVFDVIGGLFEVFRTLGPGFVYRIYANACHRELRDLRGLDILPRKEMQVFYRGRPLTGIKFFHIQVEDKFLVFPVAIGDINNIRIQNIKAWMRHLQIPLGIVANFQDTRLRPIILRA